MFCYIFKLPARLRELLVVRTFIE